MVSIDGRADSKSLIRARGLGKTYRRGGEEIHVLQGLNLDVDGGDFVAFMGPSGSGKTTLLNLLGGLDVPSEGSVTVGNSSQVTDGACVLRAAISPDNEPSLALIRRAGFVEVGSQMDEIDGLELIFEKPAG